MTPEPEPRPAAEGAGDAFERLVALVERLRGPDGCPWDRAQTRESVAPYLVEETYEVMDALRGGEAAAVREELGDLLFQVLFHADMAREADDFTVTDVIDTVHAKMVHRHPHVFGDETAATPEDVVARWEELKGSEPGKAPRESVLDGVPRSLPALLRAQKVSERAAREGFDWTGAEEVWPKVHEELDELKAAVATGDRRRAEDELGDVMFALVNLARKLDLAAEEALTGTVERFARRFAHMEQSAGRPLRDLSPDDWEGLWRQAKAAVG